MLAAVDFRNRQISLLTLSRDTMCEFQRLNPDGSERDWATGQLALTFSYGDGALKSCEITKNAVSQALSDLPIQSCSALYLDGLRRLTDAVGGVTVTVLEDLSYGYASMQPGAEVTLDGAMAERYIRARERTEEGNLKRMERQKQFFTALMKKVLASVKDARPAFSISTARSAATSSPIWRPAIFSILRPRRPECGSTRTSGMFPARSRAMKTASCSMIWTKRACWSCCWMSIMKPKNKV